VKILIQDIPPPPPRKVLSPLQPIAKVKANPVALKEQKTRLKANLAVTERRRRENERKLRQVEKVEDLLEDRPSLVSSHDLQSAPFASVDLTHTPIIFKPHEGPQSFFLAAPEQEVLYGGAAGSGKTYAIIADALRDTPNGGFTGLIIRRTNDELREIIGKTLELYPRVYPSAKWNAQKSEWVFPSGARMWLTYLERDADVLRYQGQAFSYIAVDELTQYPTPYAWDYLRSRLRTTAAHLQVYQRATSNPGGPGHTWVKKMFIDPAPWGQPFNATDIETGKELLWPSNHPNEKLAGRPLFKRRFIPGKLKDNPSLYDDGKYEANLLSMPEHLRKQLLEGSWDIVEGAAFSEFNREIHVCKPFNIPTSWRKFRACDYGYSSAAGCIWFAINPEGQLVVYRELYTRLLNAEKFGRLVLELEKEDGGITYGVMDSSVFHNKGDIGVSIAEQMANVGCSWRPADRSKGSRVNGKNELHRRLEVNETTQKPGIVIFNTCLNLIAQIPLLQLDKNNPEDVDTKGEDHLYDALRYGIMSRPVPAVTDFMILNRPSIYEEFAPSDGVFGY